MRTGNVCLICEAEYPDGEACPNAPHTATLIKVTVFPNELSDIR